MAYQHRPETRVDIFEDGAHNWKGWRIANFWNKKTSTSDDIIKFINSL
jgi:hypothetical protein